VLLPNWNRPPPPELDPASLGTLPEAAAPRKRDGTAGVEFAVVAVPKRLPNEEEEEAPVEAGVLPNAKIELPLVALSPVAPPVDPKMEPDEDASAPPRKREGTVTAAEPTFDDDDAPKLLPPPRNREGTEMEESPAGFSVLVVCPNKLVMMSPALGLALGPADEVPAALDCFGLSSPSYALSLKHASSPSSASSSFALVAQSTFGSNS